MGLLYDITKDYLYQEGLAKGEEKGLAKGREEGAEKIQRETIANMLTDQTLSTETIARFVGVSVAYVEAIAKELKK